MVRRSVIYLLPVIFLLVSMNRVLSQPFIPGEVYFGQNGYIEYRAGNLPIIITAPHGGTLEPSEIPDRTCGITGIDSRTQTLIREMEYEIYQLTGGYPHIIICRLARVKLDANRDYDEATCGNPEAAPYWYEWHKFIDSAAARVTKYWGKGFYIDIHGHGHDVPRLELGYLLSAADLRLPDMILNNPAYIQSSSIRTLAGSNYNTLTHADLLRGELSLGTMLQNAGIPAVPSMQDPYPQTGEKYFSGGFNTYRHSSHLGGTVDGVQIEHHSSIRTDHATRIAYSHDFAEILTAYLKAHYFPAFGATYTWDSSDKGISLTEIDVAYVQDFDYVFTGDRTYYLDDNDPQFPGLYAFNTLNNTKPLEFRRYTVGLSTTGNGYLFNAGHSNNVTDRALGGIYSSTTGPIGFGLRFVNNTGYTITSLDVAYTGEQWRVGGSSTSVVPNTLEFDYCTGLRMTNIRNGDYLPVTALNFISPNTSLTLAQTAIDGNTPGNRTALSASINLTLQPGEEIMLRWKDMTDDPSFDHLLAIDDLTVIPRSTLTKTEKIRGIDNRLQVYPNPARNVINFLNPGLREGQVEVFTITGVCIYRAILSEGLMTIDVSQMAPGIYMVIIRSNSGVCGTARFIKN
ncbi:MAG: T9SS type A sorting domain-containing protein [Bacteroidales bacterium]|jgi:hypothetical protein|nr:T9SS type A sorting domain-containing protein [Bacteroidales bacterium]